MNKYPPLEYNELNAADQPLATDFIQEHIERPLTIFLTNGVKLGGIITKQDKDSLILSRDGSSQMVYKHAIATIMPNNG
jgi:host factor-I protein